MCRGHGSPARGSWWTSTCSCRRDRIAAASTRYAGWVSCRRTIGTDRFHLRDEGFTPTEAGSQRDAEGPTSTSRLLRLSAAGAELVTVSQMAFWLPPDHRLGHRIARNTTAVSDHLLRKEVRIGVRGLANAIRSAVTSTVPAGERHTRGTFEALGEYRYLGVPIPFLSGRRNEGTGPRHTQRASLDVRRRPLGRSTTKGP